MFASTLLIVILSALICFYFLQALLPRLRRQLLDHPNSRSSHDTPIPRGGGVTFVVLGSVASLFSLFSVQYSTAAVLPLFACPLAVVGLFDDRLNLPALWRFLAQLMTAVSILLLSPLVKHLAIIYDSTPLFLLASLVFFVILITSVINFTNFMDGLDGLVAGCMAVVLSTICVGISASWSLWVLVGSLFGFLFWNWNPAKVFMGDVGSTFLGAVFAGLLFQASSWWEVIGYLLVATPLLADACTCVFRRLFSRQRVFQAHRLHLYQRLNQAGMPHDRVSLIYIVATGVLALAMLTGGLSWVFALALVEILTGAWLDFRFAVPFVAASKS